MQPELGAVAGLYPDPEDHCGLPRNAGLDEVFALVPEAEVANVEAMLDVARDSLLLFGLRGVTCHRVIPRGGGRWPPVGSTCCWRVRPEHGLGLNHKGDGLAHVVPDVSLDDDDTAADVQRT